MRGHEDAQARIGKLARAAEHLRLVAQVEGRSWLVHHQVLGFLRHGAGDEHHLALASGKLR